jgi:hypothetical protein
LNRNEDVSGKDDDQYKGIKRGHERQPRGVGGFARTEIMWKWTTACQVVSQACPENFKASLEIMEAMDLVADPKAAEAITESHELRNKKMNVYAAGHCRANTWVNTWLYSTTNE